MLALSTLQIIILAVLGAVVLVAILSEFVGTAWHIGQFIGDVIEGVREWWARRRE